jgi:hypothetical protein
MQKTAANVDMQQYKLRSQVVTSAILSGIRNHVHLDRQSHVLMLQALVNSFNDDHTYLLAKLGDSALSTSGFVLTLEPKHNNHDGELKHNGNDHDSAIEAYLRTQQARVSYSSVAKVRVGDVLVAVDDLPYAKFVASRILALDKNTNPIQYQAKYHTAHMAIRNPLSTYGRVTLRRPDGKTYTKSVKFRPCPEPRAFMDRIKEAS